MSARALLTGALLALALWTGAAATAEPPSRVVAIGDVHGAVDSFLTVLRQAGLADAEGRWSGGDATLVQTGDLLDRGADVRALLDLVRRLEREAEQAGGRVVALLGNHEAMNLIGEVRDVDPGAYARFADEGSEKRRKAEYKRWKSFLRRRAARLGLAAPVFSNAVREAWLEARPPGYFNYLEAMRPGGSYGRWLIERPAAVQVNDSIFVHGGISPDYDDVSLEELNRKIRLELTRGEELRQRMIANSIILPSFRRLEATQALQEELAVETARSEGTPSARHAELLELAGELDSLIAGSLAFGEQGPLWFRGLAKWSPELLDPYLPDYLDQREARRIVVAHTPDAGGRIERRLDDRIFLIDTGMQSAVYRGGRGSALEIEGERVRELYEVRPDEEMAPAGALLTPSDQPPPPPPPPSAAGRPETRLLDANGAALPHSSQAEILRLLRTGRVLEKKPIGVGVTQPDRLLLELDGVRVKAVFHDVDIQEMGARFPGRGLVADFRDSYRSQVAAFRVARLVGLDNVPPAVLREVDGVRGAAALWIEEAMMESERKSRGLPVADRTIRTREFYDMRVFDNLICNLDRNQTNILHDSFGKLWLIDHTRSFGRSPRLPNPERVVRCSRQLFEALRALTPETADSQLRGVVSKPEIRSLLKRRDRLVELLESKIAETAEHAVLFDWHDDPTGDEDEGPAVDDLPPGPAAEDESR